MAEQIENTVTVNHFPIHPFRWRADQYRITITLTRNYESDHLPMRGCTLEEPWSDDDKRFLAARGLASNWNPDPLKRLAEAHRGQLLFHPDMAAIRAHLRAVHGVRDEDLHGLTWPTIIAMLQERERLARKREIAHSDDFRSVCWFGTNYSFTSQQAEVVRILWEAYEAQTPDVDAALLLSDFTGCAAHKVRDLFRKCPAWGTMIVVGGSRGTYRLQDPR